MGELSSVDLLEATRTDERSTREELRCVLAVIRHGDRTPKQKLKVRCLFLSLHIRWVARIKCSICVQGKGILLMFQSMQTVGVCYLILLQPLGQAEAVLISVDKRGSAVLHCIGASCVLS